MVCPVCKKRIKPMVFSLWPEAAVKLCPKCRVGIEVLHRPVMSEKGIQFSDIGQRGSGFGRAKKKGGFNCL